MSDSAGHRSECPHSLLLNDLLLSRSQFYQRLFQIGGLLLEFQRSFIDQSLQPFTIELDLVIQFARGEKVLDPK